jgi:hypothetical protein
MNGKKSFDILHGQHGFRKSNPDYPVNHTLFDLETSFIIRIKSENDKRSFNYSIENENINRYLKQKKNIK